MKITITPQNLSFNKNVQGKNDTSFKKTSSPCTTSFGNVNYKKIDHIFRIFQNPFTQNQKPKAKLKPTAKSIVQYVNSLYNRESGFGVEGFDEIVSGIRKNINSRSVIFARKLVKQLPQSPNNLGLNLKLRQTLETLEQFNKNPNERKTLIKGLKQQTR